MRSSIQLLSVALGMTLAITVCANGQQASPLSVARPPVPPPPSPAVKARLPFTVKPAAGGVEVVTYDGQDGLLAAGDFLSWVATPNTDQMAAVTSPDNLGSAIDAKKNAAGQIALWITRSSEPRWITLTLNPETTPPPSATPPAVPPTAPPTGPSAGTFLPFTAKRVADGMEVITYSRPDKLLVPGDIIVRARWFPRDVGPSEKPAYASVEMNELEKVAEEIVTRAKAVELVGNLAIELLVSRGSSFEEIVLGLSPRLPFTVKKLEGGQAGLEVLSYFGPGELLEPGQHILGVGGFAWDESVAELLEDLPRTLANVGFQVYDHSFFIRAISSSDLEKKVRERLDSNGRVSFLVRAADKQYQYRVVNLHCEGDFFPEAPVVEPAP